MYFIGVRSNYALTYQTFIRSAWRLDEVPHYEDEKNLPVEAGYATYMMLRDEFDIDEIKRFHEKREY